MKWIIIKDLVREPGEQSVVGMMWAPRQSRPGIVFPNTADGVQEVGNKLPLAFRLLDDNGIVYFEGKADEEDSGPLDWAMDFAGCTSIQFRHGGRWVDL